MAISETRAKAIVSELELDLASDTYRCTDPTAAGYVKTHHFTTDSYPSPVICSRRGEWEIYRRLTPTSSSFEFCALLLRPRMWFCPRIDYVVAGRSSDMRSVEKAARVLCDEFVESRIHILPGLGYWVTYTLALLAGAGAAASVALNYPEFVPGAWLLVNMFFWIGLGLFVAIPLRTRVRSKLEEMAKERVLQRLCEDLPDEAENYRYGREAAASVTPQSLQPAAMGT